MNTLVVLFFASNVAAAGLLGVKFMSKKEPLFRYFGIGLLLDALAFAIWTVGYMNPEQLLTFVMFGAIAFLASLVFFLYASLQHAPVGNRMTLTLLGAAAMLGIFYIGHQSENSAYISQEGLLFFNLTPMVQMLYIFALSFVTIPLIDLVSSKFRGQYASLVRYGLIAQIVGGIMLITNKDVQALYITGWVIGATYLVLCATLYFNRKAWAGTN
jgi:hypothetical protein